MKKETYKDFVFLKIPKDVWREIEKIAIEKGKYTKQLSYNDLIDYKFLYERDIEHKQISALEAHRQKKARKDIQIYQALEKFFTGLFKSELEHITPYKLSKLAKVNYRTAKRFWNEYNLDYWIKEFESKGSKALNEFKINELAESLVYSK
jgi:hypothetical protein